VIYFAIKDEDTGKYFRWGGWSNIWRDQAYSSDIDEAHLYATECGARTQITTAKNKAKNRSWIVNIPTNLKVVPIGQYRIENPK